VKTNVNRKAQFFFKLGLLAVAQKTKGGFRLEETNILKQFED